MAECGSCPAEVDWVLLPSGSRMLVDRASAGDPDGNLAVRRMADGTLAARHVKPGDQLEPGEVPGKSHFSSCPDAQAWRERGRG